MSQPLQTALCMYNNPKFYFKFTALLFIGAVLGVKSYNVKSSNSWDIGRTEAPRLSITIKGQ